MQNANSNSNSKKSQLLHEEWCWECECGANLDGVLDYLAIYTFMERHHNVTGHHAGRLTIVKVVETWK